MAGLKGYEGSFRLAGTATGDINEWSLDVELNTEDDAEFGDAWEDPSPTTKKWSGSIKGKLNLSDTNQAACQTALLGGSTVSARFYTTGSAYYAGTALVTKISVSPAVNNLIPVEMTIMGKGALTPPA